MGDPKWHAPFTYANATVCRVIRTEDPAGLAREIHDFNSPGRDAVSHYFKQHSDFEQVILPRVAAYFDVFRKGLPCDDLLKIT
jgi:hypothetical protein